jgi:hypothetical protein
MKSNAYFSPDRRYRYWLTRSWDDAKPMMCVIGVNPSTADEAIDDATIRKCIGFAKRLGFGGLLMLNVGAFRATDPRNWHKAEDPFGPENTITHLKEYIAQNTVEHYPWETPTKGVTAVVAAWGKNCSKGRALARSLAIAQSIRGIQCWGKNNDGTPRHPLMLSYETQLQPLE